MPSGHHMNVSQTDSLTEISIVRVPHTKPSSLENMMHNFFLQTLTSIAVGAESRASDSSDQYFGSSGWANAVTLNIHSVLTAAFNNGIYILIIIIKVIKWALWCTSRRKTRRCCVYVVSQTQYSLCSIYTLSCWSIFCADIYKVISAFAG